jgi:hypothetical protein
MNCGSSQSLREQPISKEIDKLLLNEERFGRDQLPSISALRETIFMSKDLIRMEWNLTKPRDV